jgi:hypothetical protein
MLHNDRKRAVNAKLDELIRRVNHIAARSKTPLYLCWECGQLGWGTAKYPPATTKWDDPHSYCPGCVLHCETCDEDYPPATAYLHDDCKPPNTDALTDHQKKAFGLLDVDEFDPIKEVRLDMPHHGKTVSSSSSDSSCSSDSESEPEVQHAKVGAKRKRPTQTIVID